MEKNMTPLSEMTRGQIDKAVSNYRALLEKHAGEFNSEPVQTVLGQSELADEQFAVLRRRIEALSNLIVRHVSVNRKRSPKEALNATGRNKYVSDSVVADMPKGEGEETDVFFFKLDRYVSDDDLEKEYELRSLKPDPIAQAAVNEADPAFAENYPNGTHWKDKDGKWCFAAFRRDGDERSVYVGRIDSDWDGFWWFSGVRQVVLRTCPL